MEAADNYKLAYLQVVHKRVNRLKVLEEDIGSGNTVVRRARRLFVCCERFAKNRVITLI